MLSPTRKPTASTVAPTSTQTGQTGRAVLVGSPFQAIQSEPPDQVEQRRIDERHRAEDLAAVEERERDA